MNFSLAYKSAALKTAVLRLNLIGRRLAEGRGTTLEPLRFLRIMATAVLVLAPVSRTQGIPAPGQMGQGVPNQTQIGQSGGTMNDQLQFGTMGHQVEREQDAAYRAFLKEPDPAKKIQLGNGFLQKYPKSPFAEQVDVGLMNTYRAQQDWKNTYRLADSALALQPDDVDVLTIVSWTIPHVYNPNDPDADQELNKAERYAKHAIEVMAKMPKPHDVTDSEFAAAKAKRSSQAHSALGLVYFRRNDYDNSARELEQATKENPTPDPTDLFVLGVDLQNLRRFGDASDAFGRCAELAGPLRDRCKQNAESAKLQTDQSKTK